MAPFDITLPGRLERAGSRLALVPILGLALSALACGDGGVAPRDNDGDDGEEPDTMVLPLTQLVDSTYLGFRGGLYPNGNEPPSDHVEAGLEAAAAIEPLDVDGNPDPDGHYVLLSIGLSNTSQEFCNTAPVAEPCEPWTFVGQARASGQVDEDHLRMMNGAMGGVPALEWLSPESPQYTRVRQTILEANGLSEAQVQAIWLKVVDPRPSVSLPDENAQAFELEEEFGDILRSLRIVYPNLKMVFLTSRIYAGYATTDLHPEPYAYESAFSVKWTVEAQIRQRRTGFVDERAGDLSESVAPWIGWGPYPWANGTEPRPHDGLVWVPEDFQDDGTHPSTLGEEKVGTMLLDFFQNSELTSCWFLESGDCGS